MIVSRQNQKIKDIRRLRRCKGDRAVLEGPHLVAEALAAGVGIDSILATPRFVSEPAHAALLERAVVPVTEVAPELLEWLCDADSPRGVLAVAKLPREGVETLPVAADGTYLFLDGMQDPGNLGALVRVAEAFGVTAVALARGSAHPNHPRSLRASAGSLLRMPIAVGVEPRDLHRRVATVEPRWLVLVPREGGPVADLAASSGPAILAVGAEGPGVSKQVLELEHTEITIPLTGQVESLNSTVAVAIALYELRRSQVNP